MSNLGSLKLKLEENEVVLKRYETALARMSAAQACGVMQEADTNPFCQIAGRMLLGAWQQQRIIAEITAAITAQEPPPKAPPKKKVPAKPVKS